VALCTRAVHKERLLLQMSEENGQRHKQAKLREGCMKKLAN